MGAAVGAAPALHKEHLSTAGLCQAVQAVLAVPGRALSTLGFVRSFPRSKTRSETPSTGTVAQHGLSEVTALMGSKVPRQALLNIAPSSLRFIKSPL